MDAKVLEIVTSDKYDYLFKILIIGSSGVGKSSLLTQFTTHEFKLDTKATIGVEFTTKYIKIDDKVIKVQLWDTAGQERFRAITGSFYRGAVGALMCFDLTNSQSFAEIDKWLDEVEKFSTSCDLKLAPKDSTVLLVGNKCDLRHLRVISGDDAKGCVERRNMAGYVETSAADTTNVEQAFLEVIVCAYRNINNNKTLLAADGGSSKDGGNVRSGVNSARVKLRTQNTVDMEKIKTKCC